MKGLPVIQGMYFSDDTDRLPGYLQERRAKITESTSNYYLHYQRVSKTSIALSYGSVIGSDMKNI